MAKPKLSVIIPYNLNYGADLDRALASVYTAIGIDLAQVEVLVVNDGGSALPHKLSKRWPLRAFALAKSQGAGVARQVGLDHARGTYVMFLDADDMLASPLVLHAFFAAMATDPAVIVAPFWAEAKAENGTAYSLQAATDRAAVYAKAYRRSYLKHLGLRFHPDLRVYEDVYFVKLALDLAPQVKAITTPAYIWRLNWQSTGRRDAFAMAYEGAAWVRSNRLRLQFLQAHDQALWGHEFYEVLSTIYAHVQTYPPRDLTAFDQEVHLLMRENLRWWQLPDAKALVRAVTIKRAQIRQVQLGAVTGYLTYLEAQSHE